MTDQERHIVIAALRSQPGTLAREEEVAASIKAQVELAVGDGEYIGRHQNDMTPTAVNDLRTGAIAERRKTVDAILTLTPSHEADATYKVGRWLSAALDDPQVCQEMKNDILAWMEAGKPNVQPSVGTHEPVADNEPKLPCDFFVGSVRFHKGVKIETVRLAAERWYQAAAEQFAAPASQDATRGDTIDDITMFKATREALETLCGLFEKLPMWNAVEVNAAIEKARAALASRADKQLKD